MEEDKQFAVQKSSERKQASILHQMSRILARPNAEGEKENRYANWQDKKLALYCPFL